MASACHCEVHALNNFDRAARFELARTATSIFNSNPDNVRRGERTEAEIDVRDWLGGTKKATVLEEVVGLGNYRKTLTVLSSKYIGNKIDDSDEDEEEQLIESWMPRFRR